MNSRASAEVNSNITQERSRNPEELSREICRKNSMLRVTAHDLRLPFSTFHQFSNLAKLKYGDILGDHIDELSGIFCAGEILLKNLQVLASDVYGKPVLDFEEIPLAEVLNPLIRQLGVLAGFKKVEIVFRVGAEVSLYCDGDVLSRILENLLFAAVDRCEHRTKVVIEADAADTQTRLSWTFTGDVIPQELQDAVVSGAWGTNPASDLGIDSLGLALAAAVQLLHHHGSQLEFSIPEAGKCRMSCVLEHSGGISNEK